MFKSTIGMEDNVMCDLQHGMIVGARWTGLYISINTDLLSFFFFLEIKLE